MLDLSDVPSVRKLLILMCRNPLLRVNPPDVEMPHNWTPYDVLEPHTLSMYTDESAWEYIADCLENGACVTCQPPSSDYPDHAYVMVEEDDRGARIYMKIAINPRVAKKIIGVSFHHARR